jgi:hypothetical protein
MHSFDTTVPATRISVPSYYIDAIIFNSLISSFNEYINYYYLQDIQTSRSSLNIWNGIYFSDLKKGIVRFWWNMHEVLVNCIARWISKESVGWEGGWNHPTCTFDKIMTVFRWDPLYPLILKSICLITNKSMLHR